MTKIWNEAFWKNAPSPTFSEPDTNIEDLEDPVPVKTLFLLYLPIVLFAIVILMMGLFADLFLSLTTRAANQLMDPTAYIQCVLRGTP